MNSASNPILIKFSDINDGPEIVEFLRKNSAETDNVFFRKPELLEAQAELGRILTVRDRETNELLSMSSVYILGHEPKAPPPPPSINCIIHSGGVFEKGVVAELGSVIKKLPEDPNDPKGYNRLVHFCLPPLLALRFDMEIDVLVTEIFHTNPFTKKFISDGRIAAESSSDGFTRFMEGSPVFYPQIPIIHGDLRKACGATSADSKGIESTRDFYRIPVSSVVGIAQTFKQVLEHGYIPDLRSKYNIGHKPNMRTYVDLSQLKFRGANGSGTKVSLEELINFILEPINTAEFSKPRAEVKWRAAIDYADLLLGSTTSSNKLVQPSRPTALVESQTGLVDPDGKPLFESTPVAKQASLLVA